MDRSWMTPERYMKGKKEQRRVTGSIDLPLNDTGRKQAATFAKHIKKVDLIRYSPKKRSKETAEIIAKELGVKAIAAGALRPWRQGGLEGQLYSKVGKEREKLILEHSDKIPAGKGNLSTDEGESFPESTDRLIGDFQKQIENWNGTDCVLNIMHGWNLSVIDAYIKAGKRNDKYFDPKDVLNSGERLGGDLFLAHPGVKELTLVENMDCPGIYQGRHGETDWSSS